MEKFKHIQVCTTRLGWQPVQVPSQSEPGKNHLVSVNLDIAFGQWVCDCKGFLYRGRCNHQIMAVDYVCFWQEGDEEQTPEERRARVCPRCMKRTRWEVVIDE